jgi:predicted metal-dependent phosphoesterase TrpH
MRLDIHVHSIYSDGANTPEEIAEYAKKIGLDGIAVTDHDEIEGSLEALKFNSDGFLVIPGIEISTREGHILALWVNEIIERDLPAEETIARIHELGGIAIATHPYDRIRSGVGDLIYELDFDAVELYNGHTFSSRKNPEDIARDIRLPITGGSDAHRLEEIGSIIIKTGNMPRESILKGDVEVEINTNRLKIAMSYAKAFINDIPGIIIPRR